MNKCSAASGLLAQFSPQCYCTGMFKPLNSSNENRHLVMPVLQVVPKKISDLHSSVSCSYFSVYQQAWLTACNYLWIMHYSRGVWGQIVTAFCIIDILNKKKKKERKQEKKEAGNWWWWKMLSWWLKDGTCTMYLEIARVSLTSPVPGTSSLGRKLFNTPETP